jgi:hypothetical protein
MNQYFSMRQIVYEYRLSSRKKSDSTAHRHEDLAIFSRIFKEMLTPEYESFRIFRLLRTKARLCETLGI